jgi:hypothetical protein
MSIVQMSVVESPNVGQEKPNVGGGRDQMSVVGEFKCRPREWARRTFAQSGKGSGAV